MKPIAVIKKYFGTKPDYKGETGSKGFKKELEELSKPDWDELVKLAAKELSVEVDSEAAAKAA